MDLLLSLPIASYLLTPSASWSASLNLLFFYMTWTTLVLSHSALKIRLVGTLFLRLTLWLVPSLASLLFDLGLPSLAESIKLAGRAALPEPDVQILSRRFGLAVFNLLLVTLLEGASSLVFASVFGQQDFKTSTTLPLPWQIAKHTLVLFLTREALVYTIHRCILHGGGSRLATYHTSYAHARSSAPHSLLLFADHPLPFLLHRFLPIYLPSLILRPHLLTYFLFLGLCTTEETLAMSGYSVVPGIVMGGIARRSAVHYVGDGGSNYGAWGLLDWVCGTSRGGDVLGDVRAEAEKHKVKDRAVKEADEGMGVLQGGIDAWRNGNRTRKSQRLSKKTKR